MSLTTAYKEARAFNRKGGLVQAAGDLGLLAAFCFWGWVLWGFVKPQFTDATHALTLESAITGAFLAGFAIVLALCCAFVMPALCAAIFPHTAAAQYLQEIRRSAWGFWLLSGSCLLLLLFTLYILDAWWTARLAVTLPDGSRDVDLLLVRALTVMTTIFFVVVPSWATNYGSPVLWLAEVQQAHQVEKLKLQHKQDIALAKAAYRRALNILKAGLDSATVEQREYVSGVLLGLHQAERALMLDIAGTIDEDARLERALPTYDDPAITQRYDELHHALVAGTPVVRNDARSDASERAGAAPAPHTKSYERARAADHPGPSRTIPHDGDYTIAYEHFGRESWTVKDLATVLAIEPETAAKRRRAWQEAGLVSGRGMSNGRYCFLTESEA